MLEGFLASVKDIIDKMGIRRKNQPLSCFCLNVSERPDQKRFRWLPPSVLFKSGEKDPCAKAGRKWRIGGFGGQGLSRAESWGGSSSTGCLRGSD